MNTTASGEVTGRNSAINKDDHYTRFDWIFPVSTSLLLMVVALWLLMSLIHYAVKTRKCFFNGRSSSREILNSGFIYVSVIVCALMCLFRFSVSVAFMNVGYEEGDREICNHLADAAYSAYASVMLSRAMFLWFRQRAFFSNKMLNVSYNKVVKFFSFSSIFIIVVYGTTVSIHAMIPQDYQSSANGCVYQPNHKLQAGYWVPALVGIALMNVMLLGLFLYAIIHVRFAEHKRKQVIKKDKQQDQNRMCNKKTLPGTGDIFNGSQKARRRRSSYMFKKRTLSFIKTRNKIKKILQHTFLFAIISFGSDIFSQVFSNMIIKANDHRRFSFLIFDTNAMVYLLFIIFSFDDFHKIIFSFFPRLFKKPIISPETS